MDVKLNELIEATFASNGNRLMLDTLPPEGKQYINALMKHCKDKNIPVPYAPAHRICKEKFGFQGTVDTFRRNIIVLTDKNKTL